MSQSSVEIETADSRAGIRKGTMNLEHDIVPENKETLMKKMTKDVSKGRKS